jgi:RNA recognition motif-containing protein
MKLFVGNLPHASGDTQLREWIEARGFVVETVDIVRDRSTGQSRGFGFVVLKNHSRIEQAITALNGQRMNGRILTVNRAVPESPRDVALGRGPGAWRDRNRV